MKNNSATRNIICTISKVTVLVLVIFLLNLATLPNYYQVTAATNLTSDALVPKLNSYWVYENEDLENGKIVRFTLNFTGEKVISIENKQVTALVFEGTGEYIVWGNDIAVIPDRNSIYFKREIIKSNFERVTYTQNLDLEFFEDGNWTKKYIHEFTIYNITYIDKPDNITIGNKWSRNETVKTIQENTDDEFPVPLDDVRITSTFECDRITIPDGVPAGSFNCFRIVEYQWIAHPEGPRVGGTIMRYYSIDTKSLVKMERINDKDEIVERETLVEYKLAEPENGENPKPNNDGNDTDDQGIFGMGSLADMLIFSGIVIVIIGVIAGIVYFKKK